MPIIKVYILYWSLKWSESWGYVWHISWAGSSKAPRIAPHLSPSQIQNQKQQGFLAAETPVDTPTRAAMARITQHPWAIYLAPLLPSSMMTLGEPLVLSGPWCSHLENGADSRDEMIYLATPSPSCPGCGHPFPQPPPEWPEIVGSALPRGLGRRG